MIRHIPLLVLLLVAGCCTRDLMTLRCAKTCPPGCPATHYPTADSEDCLCEGGGYIEL